MEKLLSRCGYDCGKCQLYKDNLITDEARIKCSKGMKKYINWQPDPKKLKQCYGCNDGNDFCYLKNCLYKLCCNYNEFENCSECELYPCRFLPSEVQHGHAEAEKRYNKAISKEDYENFIEVYEGRYNLDIERTKNPENIKKVKPVEPTKFDSNFAEAEKSFLAGFYKKIYAKLGSFYAEEVSFKAFKDFQFKLLWLIFTSDVDKNNEIIISSSQYYDFFKNVKWMSSAEGLKNRMVYLHDEGIECEIYNPDNNQFLTKTGAVRRQGWFLKIKLQFMAKSENVKHYNKIKKAAKALIKHNPRTAFTKFKKLKFD